MRPLSPIACLATWLLLSMSLSSAAQTRAGEQADQAYWSVTPCLWASDTELQVTVKDADINGDVSIPVDELLNLVDSSFQIHVEGGQGRWSAFVDATFISTSDTQQSPEIPVDTDSQQIFVDAAVVYWPGGVGSSLIFLGGIRYTDFANDYTFVNDAGPFRVIESSSHYYDALVDVRYGSEL